MSWGEKRKSYRVVNHQKADCKSHGSYKCLSKGDLFDICYGHEIDSAGLVKPFSFS